MVRLGWCSFTLMRYSGGDIEGKILLHRRDTRSVPLTCVPACRYLRASRRTTNHHTLIAGRSGRIAAESTGITNSQLFSSAKMEVGTLFGHVLRLLHLLHPNFIRSCSIASNHRTFSAWQLHLEQPYSCSIQFLQHPTHSSLH